MVLTSILIIAVSLVLLVYWFRYTCILLVRNSTAPSVAETPSRFCIAEVQNGLRSGEPLDSLQVALQKDYNLVVYLVEHAAGLEMQSIEDRLLVWDYKVLSAYYRLTKLAAPRQARSALSEMAAVIEILAGKLVERAGVQTHA